MKNLRRRGLSLLLAAFTILTLPVAAAGSVQKQDPYIYIHDNTASGTPYLHRSPHRYAYTEGSGYIPAMYILESGSDEMYVYCCDLITSIVETGKTAAYRRLNLEDAGYYSEEAARHIRGVLKAGYWPGRSNLSELEKATGAEGLTAAEALSATQAVIWTFSNNNTLTDIYVGTKNIEDTKGIKDTNTIPPTEGGKTSLTKIQKTDRNIRAVYDYLMNQVDDAPASVIWTFEGEQVVLTAGSQTNFCDVTVMFQMKGSSENTSDLVLTAQLTNGGQDVCAPKKYAISDNDAEILPSESGIYTITFENIALDALNDNTAVKLSLSGTQQVANDVYFYEPVGGRNTAQCFVGYAEGETPIYSEVSVTVPRGRADFSLVKYDGSMGGQGSGTGEEDTGTGSASSGGIRYPMAGVEFALYYAIDGGTPQPYPNLSNRKTDENGKIVWENLALVERIHYFCKEVNTPSGYFPAEDLIPLTVSEEKVENRHVLGDLEISKTTRTAGEDGNGFAAEHFDFKVVLDFNTADLAENNYSWLDIGTQYSTLNIQYDELCSTGAGIEQIHPNTVSFTETETGSRIYEAVFSLADGETAVIKGLPEGTAYTVSELDEKGEPVEDNQMNHLNETIYVCLDGEQSGVISGPKKDDKETAVSHVSFLNLEYEPDSFVPTGKKYLNGSLSSSPFSFTLTDITDENSPKLLETVTNEKNGIILFAPIHYEKAGTYRYEIKEVKGGGGYLYDTAVYTVSVTVTQDTENKKLVTGVPVIVKSNTENSPSEIEFYNRKSGGGSEYTSVTVKKVWKLNDGGEKTDSVIVELLRDGESFDTVKLSSENNWRHVWNRLSDRYTWTVAEIDVPDGFVSSVDKNGMTFTITNDDDSHNPDDPKDPKGSENPGTPQDLNGSDEPKEPVEQTLPQTGIAWYPVILLTAAGVFMIIAENVLRRKQKNEGK